jgi:hypothetical protein
MLSMKLYINTLILLTLIPFSGLAQVVNGGGKSGVMSGNSKNKIKLKKKDIKEVVKAFNASWGVCSGSINVTNIEEVFEQINKVVNKYQNSILKYKLDEVSNLSYALGKKGCKENVRKTIGLKGSCNKIDKNFDRDLILDKWLEYKSTKKDADIESINELRQSLELFKILNDTYGSTNINTLNDIKDSSKEFKFDGPVSNPNNLYEFNLNDKN